MKLTKENFQKICIIILLLSSTRFLYVLPLPSFFLQSASNVMCCAFFSGIICIIFWIINKKIDLGTFGIEIFILYALVIINCFFMFLQYGYSWKNIYYCLVPFLVLLGYFPLVQFIQSKASLHFILKCVEWIALLLAIVLLLQKYEYDKNNLLFLKINIPLNFNGRFYDVSEGIIRIAVLISAYYLITKQINFINIFCFIGSSLSIILVDQSRIYLLSVILAIFVMLVINMITSEQKSNLIIYLLLIIVGIIIASTLYSSLRSTLNNINDGSNYARNDAINYYFSALKHHIWTGLGLYVPSIGEAYSDYIKGPLGIYNYSDIGIFGIYASLGLGSVIWYIWILIKGIKIACFSANKVLCWGLVSEMIVSMFTMTYFDSSRQFSLVLVLVILSVSSHKISLMNNKSLS